MHGIESDWIEDEMGDDDDDFINIVLEQKVKTAFAKAGWAKKLNFLEVFRWSDGPLHRSHPPVVVTFKSWLECWKGNFHQNFFLQEGEKVVIKSSTSRLAEHGNCTHRRLQVHESASPFKLFSRSRLAGSKGKTSKLLTLNVFLNYYSEYDTGDTGLRIFNEWIKLV